MYQCFQPNDSNELREYMLYAINSQNAKNLSPRLVKYLADQEDLQERILKFYKNDVLLVDSVFESGNLLQADRIDSGTYNFYMQVDTNTKGHQ